MNKNVKNVVPPPWKLKGRGYIFIYKFKKDFIQNYGFLEHPVQYYNGFGSMMIVKYLESNAGPYDELLFIPGVVKIHNKKNFHISKIYVSTQISVDSGRENWYIPKELANFSFEENNNIETIRVGKEKQIFFEAEIIRHKFKFPIYTGFLPFSLQQLSTDSKQIKITKFKGKGKASFCKIKQIQVIPDYFPPIGKPIIGICVDPFELEFPVPETIPL